MMIKQLFLLVIFTSNAYSQSLSNGVTGANALIGNVNQTSPLSSNPQNTVPGFVTSSPSEMSYSSGDISGAATSAATSDPAAQLINHSFATRPNITINRSTSPIFQNAANALTNPNAIVNSLTSTYGSCQATTPVNSINSDIRTCDEYTETTDQTCQVGNVVTVDTKHQYKCNRSRVYNDYTCNRSLTLTCATQGCDAGVLTKGAFIDTNILVTAPNVIWSYSYPSLSISETVPNPNGWGNHTSQRLCAFFQRALHFTVSDITKLTKFKLLKASFIGFVEVKINGTIIYDGSKTPIGLGYSRVSPSDHYNYNGTNYKCAQEGAYSDSLAINLLPYLKQGDNIISFVSLFAAYEQVYKLDFDTAQVCCNQWNESWTDNCGAYQ